MLFLFCLLILCQRKHRKDLPTYNNGISVRHGRWAQMQDSTRAGQSAHRTGILIIVHLILLKYFKFDSLLEISILFSEAF